MRERRVTGAAVRRIADGLSERDRAILADVARVRVLTGRQVQRLHFAGLTGRHRDRTRRQVLQRLVEMEVLATLARHIGGVRTGSEGLVFAVGLAGQRMAALLEGDRARRPATPTPKFLDHTLAGSELYVQLVEAARRNDLAIGRFSGEPMCWWRDSEGKWVKPDAYAIVAAGDIEDGWAIEVDMGTESEPTLRRELKQYVNLAIAGESGPRGEPLPRVLVAVTRNSPYLATSEAVQKRLATARRIIAELPPPADQLLGACAHEDAVQFMCSALRE